MAEATASPASVAEQLQRAYAEHDLKALGALLAEDVRWGDDDNPRKCRSRQEAVSVFGDGLRSGADGEVNEMIPGEQAILCSLTVRGPEGASRAGRRLYHVYVLRDGLIAEIRVFGDRKSAAEAAGI